MPITSEAKKELMAKFAKHEKDTGSVEVQIAIMSQHIKNLTEHFQKFKKDNGSKRGMLKVIGKRKRLLKYLAKKNPEKYHQIAKELGIRVKETI